MKPYALLYAFSVAKLELIDLALDSSNEVNCLTLDLSVHFLARNGFGSEGTSPHLTERNF
jgi:hypothetical protein